ncbi:MAG: hypothetical protein B0D92_05770 [Spirochaeta sp. LUC14_002_19_P3]|nr:MAG: hypothetical protein B0D92_05770 [Spirochaeta sp. LUC14_002_19_P3]
MPKYKRHWFISLAILVLTSCASVEDTLDTDWSPEIFFKNAQEALDDSRYKDAMFYYEVFTIRYPENIQKNIAADYEKAFIHYKTGKLKQAEEGFKEILKEYEESPYAMLFQPRFKQLCEIGLTNIERSKSVNNKLFWRLKERKWAEDHGEELLDTPDAPQV